MAKDNTGIQLKPSASPLVEMNDGFPNLRGEDAYQDQVIGSAFPIRAIPSTHPHILCQDLHGTTSLCNEDTLTADASPSTDIFQFSQLAKIVEPIEQNKNDYDVIQGKVDSVTLSQGPELGTAEMYRILSQANALNANSIKDRTAPLQWPLSERNLFGIGGGINIAPQNSMANLQNTCDPVIESSQLGCSAYLQASHVVKQRRCIQDDANIGLSLDLRGRELTCSNDLLPQLAEDLIMYDRSQPVGFLIPNEGDSQKNNDGYETCGRVLSQSVEKLDGKSLTLGRGGSAMVPGSAVSNSSSTHEADWNAERNFLSQAQLANDQLQYLIGRHSNLGLVENQNVANACINSRSISYAGFPPSHETELLHNQTIGDSSRQHQMTHFLSSLSHRSDDTAQIAFDVVQRGAMLTDFSLSTASTQMNSPVGNSGIFPMPTANSPGFPQWQKTPLVCNQTIQHSSWQCQLTRFPNSLSQPFHYTAIDSVQRGPILSDWSLSTVPTQMNPTLGNPGMFIGPANNPQGFLAWLEALRRQNENAQNSYQQHQTIPLPSSLSQHLHTTAQRASNEVQRNTMLPNQRFSTASTPVNSSVGISGTSTSPMDNQPGYWGQPRADHQVEQRSNVSIPLSADIVTTVKGHGHPQVSSTCCGRVRKRGGGQSPLATTPSVRRPRTQPQLQVPRLQSPQNQSSLVPLSPPRPNQSYPNQESKSLPCGRNVGQTSPSLLSSTKAALLRRQQSPVIHIKCEDKDGEHQLSGHKCFICKRDLSYPPEGPIVRPPNPVPTAVLPCGHTFHDRCLHQITPENDIKDPPCIPCALGED